MPPSAEEKQKYIDGALNYADYLMKELGSEEGIQTWFLTLKKGKENKPPKVLLAGW